MPFLTAETTDERDSLATFAKQQIDQVATALHGLDREQLALTPSASWMSLGALARHVLLIGGGAALTIAAAPGPGADPARTPELDLLAPVPDAPWFEGRTTWSLRWYALHQIEEGARHAGHADILRESIDGKGAYELNARADGQEWPPAGW
jgi:hypothetical protein